MKGTQMIAACRWRSLVMSLGITLTLAGGALAAGAPRAPNLTRIAAIGGDVTEILYALGLGASIVAVDTTSQYPAEALEQKKSLGYMRALSAEGVLSTNPSIIFASAGAGPPEVVRALKSASVPYVEVEDEPSPVALLKKITVLAGATGREADGERLCRRIKEVMERLERARAAVARPLNVLFVLGVQGGRAVVGGRGSSADAMLRLAGANNAASAITGYKPISEEGLLAMAPDVILVMRREPGTLRAIEQIGAVASTPAGSNGRVHEVDGLSLLGFGPRTPEAILALMASLYPGVAGRTEPKP
jgi:iron complex transport system substrate-binding protein